MPKDQPKHHDLSFTEGVTASESHLLDADSPSKGRTLIHGANHGEELGQLFPDGRTRWKSSGPPSQGEDNVLSAARVLRHRLNDDGALWNREEVVAERGGPVDFWLHDDQNRARLAVQVTRVFPSSDYRKQQAERGQAGVLLSGTETADMIRGTIEEKLSKLERQERDDSLQIQLADLVLALHCEAGPSLPLSGGIFELLHGEWLSDLPFAAVWLVGPEPGLCHRLV